MKEIQYRIKKYSREIVAGILAVSCFLFVLGIVQKSADIVLIADILILLHNILYSIKEFKERFLFFLFHITFFLFFLGRPMLLKISGQDWIGFQIQNYQASAESVWMTVIIIFLSLLFIYLGCEAADHMFLKKTKEKRPEKKKFMPFSGVQREWIRKASGAVFLLSFACKLVLEIEKAVFISQNSYTAYYAGFQSQMPYIIYIISTFLSYMLFLYLASMPDKKHAAAALIMYVFSDVPTFIFGQRGPFVIALLVSLTYYMLRDYLGDTVKWIGKFEKILMAAGIPALIVLLGMMNYTRDGKLFDLGLLSIVSDFVIKQGVTFSWVCGGMAAISALRSMCNISYTFGPFIDYVTHSSLAQILFHASSIPNGNSLQKVFEGNCMDHSLSYLLKGEEMYLQGNGTGSSYLLELYSDFGIVGIIIFSFLLGMALCLLFRLTKKGVIPAFTVLCTVTGIAGMPRSYAIGMIEFILRPSFWLTILFAVCVAMIPKWMSHRKKISAI